MVKVKDLLYIDSAGKNNSSIPSGDIDLKSLIQDGDFWQSPYKQIDKDRKTLLYHTWFMSDKTVSLYYKLKAEGFEIYFQKENGQYSTNPSSGLSLSTDKLESTDEIAIDFIQKMPSLKLIRDEVQILDYKLITNLLDDPEKEYPEENTLLLSDIGQDRVRASDIMDYEARINPGLKIINDIKRDYIMAGDPASIAEVKNLDIKSKPTHIQLNSSIFAESKEDVLKLDPTSIESLEIGYNSDHAFMALKIYSQNIKNLKMLNLGAQGLISKNFSDFTFPNLEELRLHKEDIDEKHKNLFGKNLKILELQNCTIMSDISFIDIEFPNLEFIDFSETEAITDKNLDVILSKTGDRLQKLYLRDIANTENYNAEGEYNFLKLKDLSFSEGFSSDFINPNLVKKLFNATGENLEYLEISKHVNLKDFDIDSLSFPNLKAISIQCRNDNFDLPRIRKLLESASDNLESIDLSCDIDALETLEFEGVDFPKLRAITISAQESPKDSSLILKILDKVGDDLEFLSLTGMNIPDSEDLKKYSFGNLYCLALSRGEYNRESLEIILNSAKDSIKSLEFTGISLDDDSAYDGELLTKIKEIGLHGIKADDNFLNGIIDVASNNLREIRINKTGDIYNFSAVLIPNLEVINLENVCINSETLYSILESCHNSIKSIFIGNNYLPDEYLERLEKLDFPNLVNFVWSIPDIACRKTADYLHKIYKENIGDYSDSEIIISSEEDTQPTSEEQINTPLIDFLSADNSLVTGNVVTGGISGKPIFYSMDDSLYDGIAMNHARIKPYDYLHKTEDEQNINSAFFLMNFKNDKVKECNISRGKLDDFNREEGKSYVKVLIDQFPISTEYRFLPSLSIREEITLLESEEDIEFEYDKYHNFYKIRAKSGEKRNIELKYIMEIPNDIVEEFNDVKNNHPEEIQTLIDELKDFGAKNLEGVAEGDKKTTQEWIDLFYSQKVGRCSHRAILFKAKLEEIQSAPYLSRYEVNLVTNGIHDFCEYRINPDSAKEGEDISWKSVDIGGINGPILLQKNELEVLEAGLALAEEKSSKQEKTKSRKAKSKENLMEAIPPISLEEIYLDMKEKDGKKYLLKLLGKKKLEDAQSAISILTDLNEDKIFKVKSAKDLICSRPIISKDEGYESEAGKVNNFGGQLYDYIQKAREDSKGKKYVITIDLSTFSPSEIVRYNSMFDEVPSIDGVAIPANIRIFALTNPYSVNYYDGFDFIRRFDKANIYDKVKAPNLEEIAFVEEEEISDSLETINLYEQSNWKDILFGKWIIDKGKIKHTAGELTSKLKAGKTEFHISNANWDTEFTNFWRQAAYDEYFIHDGTKYNLPIGFKIKKSQGYNLSDYKDFVKFEGEFVSSIQTINPSYAYMLFDGYRPNPSENAMEIEAGLIKQNAGGILSINLSRKLDESIWAKILDNCRKHNTKLAVHVSSQDTLPAFAKDFDEFIDTEKTSRDMIIASKDPGFEAMNLAEKATSPLIIDISEASAKNIVGTISGEYNKAEQKFVFEQKSGFLQERLYSGQTIILKGSKLSAETKDVLSKLFIERNIVNTSDNSQLIVITDNVIGLTGTEIIQAEENFSSKTDAKKYAISNFGIDIFDVEKEDSSKREKIDFKTSKSKTEEFQKVREEKLDKVLAHNPYVWLYGNAGVGKTKFVSDYAEMKSGNLHLGYESIESWARDKSDSPKYLFIDEANLKNTDYTIFESMFSYYNSHPVILLENEIIELNDNHKGIFAGNPINHGNHRNIPALLEKHGGAVTFHQLPIYFIYEKMLKNIFGKEEEILGQKMVHSRIKCNRPYFD